jgi:ADP-L-glycero-D-manno-heptose 6-epimerase
MKILVTGGAGFIGSNLSIELEKRGHSVTVIDNFSSGNIKNLDGFSGRVVKGDVSLSKLADALKGEKFDVISHQAAITDTTFSDDKEMMRANVEGFRNILEFARLNRTPVVYASSAATYGRGKSPMREDQQPEPLNAYALSKETMDDIARPEMKKGLAIVGLRYFNVYGPHESYKGSAASMMYQLYLKMKAGVCPRVFKYGEQERDFIYVKDVVSANIKAIEKVIGGGSGIFNVGTGGSASFNKMIEELNKNMGTHYAPDYFDNPYGFYQDVTTADMTLSGEELGFKAEYDIEKGIKDYLKYLK